MTDPQQAIYKEPKILVSLLESASEGVIVVRRDGAIVLVNARVENMFGYDRQDLLGKPIGLLIPEQSRQIHREHIHAYFASPRKRPMGTGFDLSGQRRDGTIFPVEVSLSFVGTAQGPLVMSLITDISQRKEAEQILHQRTAELQARNQELDAFAHTVAHDLKNPLGLIVGFAEVLREYHNTLSPAEIEKHLRSITRSAFKMRDIIEAILVLAGARQQEIDVQPLEMEEIVQSALASLEYVIKQYRAEILIPPAWPSALGYGPWVEQVWTNYISNAIKYGGRPPRIELTATHQGNAIRFEVRDNGEGLSPEAQSRLFAPFTRLAQVRIEGHGLGLSVVRHIVERLDGQVGVESTPGQGSTFYFTLPAAG